MNQNLTIIDKTLYDNFSLIKGVPTKWGRVTVVLNVYF